jgi:hypothetical protein
MSSLGAQGADSLIHPSSSMAPPFGSLSPVRLQHHDGLGACESPWARRRSSYLPKAIPQEPQAPSSKLRGPPG